jgi:hypothetical protein
MLAHHWIEALLRHEERLTGPALSVYLDVDQSTPRNRNREFEATLQTLLRRIEGELEGHPEELARFREDAAGAESFVAAYRPQAKSLVIFCDRGSDLFWAKGVQVALPEAAEWRRGLLLRPLIEALDEHERYVVVLADRARARVYLAHMGEIEEHRCIFEADVRRTKTVGTDHWRSQANFERRVKEHARTHVHETVQALLEAERSGLVGSIILAGEERERAQVETQLPKRLRGRVVASIPLPFESSLESVLEEVRQIEQKAERRAEEQIVENLLTAAGKGRGAVTGLAGTLQALCQGRIYKLVYAEHFRADRAACLSCGNTDQKAEAPCETCGAPLQPAENLLDAVVEQVERSGGEVEAVKDEAAKLLTLQDGGIGAILRY